MPCHQFHCKCPKVGIWVKFFIHVAASISSFLVSHWFALFAFFLLCCVKSIEFHSVYQYIKDKSNGIEFHAKKEELRKYLMAVEETALNLHKSRSEMWATRKYYLFCWIFYELAALWESIFFRLLQAPIFLPPSFHHHPPILHCQHDIVSVWFYFWVYCKFLLSHAMRCE